MAGRAISFTEDDWVATREAELLREAFAEMGACLKGKHLNARMQAASEAMKLEKVERAKNRGSVRRMKICDGDNGAWTLIRVKVDSGAENRRANFLTWEIANKYNLGPLKDHEEAVSFVLLNKTTVNCKKSLSITWWGNDDRKRKTEFFVLPEGSYQLGMPYLSQHFDEEYGDYLFEDKEEEGPVAFVAQRKKTGTEMRQIEQTDRRWSWRSRDGRNRGRRRRDARRDPASRLLVPRKRRTTGGAAGRATRQGGTSGQSWGCGRAEDFDEMPCSEEGSITSSVVSLEQFNVSDTQPEGWNPTTCAQ
ncbi:hypothetical protein QBC34DRAFT_390031 [Podospora aff. communis PSN243]|uniref:Uncharacterized protein n=1 Tax=Podospora aff. communis PSN243 TaxID=3040156 RepID=A0AAV9H4Y6_9PEZI|nr:hypothetical protein QBC34DRAFT_390031 [Podospora aff. communis PSN243]